MRLIEWLIFNFVSINFEMEPTFAVLLWKICLTSASTTSWNSLSLSSLLPYNSNLSNLSECFHELRNWITALRDVERARISSSFKFGSFFTNPSKSSALNSPKLLHGQRTKRVRVLFSEMKSRHRSINLTKLYCIEVIKWHCRIQEHSI